MDEGQVCDEGRVFDVQVVLGHLLRGELALVCDCLRRERVDVKPRLRPEHRSRLLLGHLANAKKFTLEVTRG